jgi:hypothetical protein
MKRQVDRTQRQSARNRGLIMNYTKGPWYVGAQNDGLFIIDQPPRPAPLDDLTAGPRGLRVLAKLYDNDARARADAKLMALAPQMFEELAQSIIEREEAAKVLRGVGLSGMASILEIAVRRTRDLLRKVEIKEPAEVS